MKIADLNEEPALFKFKHVNYISTLDMTESGTMRWCLNMLSGLLHKFPMDVEVEESDLCIANLIEIPAVPNEVEEDFYEKVV